MAAGERQKKSKCGVGAGKYWGNEMKEAGECRKGSGIKRARRRRENSHNHEAIENMHGFWALCNLSPHERLTLTVPRRDPGSATV